VKIKRQRKWCTFGGWVKNQKTSLESIGYGGESVSQSPLKDQAFSTFLDQNPPFELPPEMGFRLRQKPVPSNGPSSTTVPPSD
jgi:hypothetical protein